MCVCVFIASLVVEVVVVDLVEVEEVVSKREKSIRIDLLNQIKHTNGAADVGVGAIGGRGIC
jgi:hypothetical protein